MLPVKIALNFSTEREIELNFPYSNSDTSREFRFFQWRACQTTRARFPVLAISRGAGKRRYAPEA